MTDGTSEISNSRRALCRKFFIRLRNITFSKIVTSKINVKNIHAWGGVSDVRFFSTKPLTYQIVAEQVTTFQKILF
jgi:hypothetical protein